MISKLICALFGHAPRWRNPLFGELVLMDAQEQRRLLELAAKAAGHQYAPHGGYIVVDGIPGNWNPLTDDGDALRLAEKCGLTVCMDGLGTVSACDERQRMEVFCTQSINECGSRIEATRLAIVRAAAAIGEKMEEEK